jgi:hypothetical protein
MVTATAAHKTALPDQRRIVPIKNEGGQSTRVRMLAIGIVNLSERRAEERRFF